MLLAGNIVLEDETLVNSFRALNYEKFWTIHNFQLLGRFYEVSVIKNIHNILATGDVIANFSTLYSDIFMFS